MEKIHMIKQGKIGGNRKKSGVRFIEQDALNGRGLFLFGPSSSPSSSLQTSSWPFSLSSAGSSVSGRACSWARLGEFGDKASLFGVI